MSVTTTDIESNAKMENVNVNVTGTDVNVTVAEAVSTAPPVATVTVTTPPATTSATSMEITIGTASPQPATTIITTTTITPPTNVEIMTPTTTTIETNATPTPTPMPMPISTELTESKPQLPAVAPASELKSNKNIEEIITVAIVAPTLLDEVDNKKMTATTMEANANTNEQVANGENVNGNAPANKRQQQTMQQMQVQATSTDKGQMDNDASMANFKVLYVVTQLCGLTMIVLVGCWVGMHLGGLGGTDTPNLEFNWHPLLMTIGFIFLYGNSILIYRGFRNTRKKALKITHASIHMGAFILTVIALKTAFDSHNLAANPIANMYSIHSWLGLSAVILFCLQYISGFMAYMVPGLKDNYKIALMPLHIYFGLFGFGMSLAAALMGITEKAIFTGNYSSLPNSAVMANLIGVLYVIFGGLVFYLATEPSYKRKPIPEDVVLLTGANE